MLLGQKIKPAHTIQDIDSLMAEHKDICERAKCAIEKKGNDLALFIRDKLSFRDKRN